MKSSNRKYSLDKLPTGSWRVRFHMDGGKRRSISFKTIAERDRFVRSIKRGLSLTAWFSSPDSQEPAGKNEVLTFRALAKEWLSHGENIREISESCLINYRSHLKHHILPILGKVKLTDLSIPKLEELAVTLKSTKPQTRSYVSVRNKHLNDEFYEDDEYLSTSYRREILMVACMVAKFGYERDHMESHPFLKYKLPESPEQPYDYWRLADEDKFLQWLEDGGAFYTKVAKHNSVKDGNPQYYMKRIPMRKGKAEELFDIVLFALRSGLRKGEIGGLHAKDVDFDNNSILVNRTWSEKEGRMKATTKSKRYRRIEMNEDMRRILQKRIVIVGDEDKSLFNIRSWAVKNFSKYCKKADVREIHFHSLRHTCLTNLANGFGLKKPLPLPQVQKIAGHSEISTTMRYVHTDGIKNTSSLQLSYSERKELRQLADRQDDINCTSAQLAAFSSGNSTFKVIEGGVE